MSKKATDAIPVFDPYKHKERYVEWDGSLPDVTEPDATLIREYIQDMRDGVNVTGKKGKRGYTRLNTIRSRMAVLSRLIRSNTGKDLIRVEEDALTRMFSKMRDGEIKRQDGKPYKSVADYTISYKAFWHWYMKRERKQGRRLEDKTLDLDTTQEKPRFNYLTYDQVKQLADNANPYYRMLIWFLFDAGCRAPTELMNLRVNDLSRQPDGIYQAEIRDETSKTFGRRIKLLLCSEMLHAYIQTNGLKGDDRLFTISPQKTNKYLGRLGYRVLKLGEARIVTSTYSAKKDGEPIQVEQRMRVVRDGLTLYDLRHSSACYWLPRYKSESALKYRFGWKNSDMIHYYTELLGMKDTITEADLIDADEKSRLDAQLAQQQQKNALLEDELKSMQDQMREVLIRMGVYDKALSEAKKLMRENRA